jgi:hypothetical protein
MYICIYVNTHTQRSRRPLSMKTMKWLSRGDRWQWSQWRQWSFIVNGLLEIIWKPWQSQPISPISPTSIHLLGKNQNWFLFSNHQTAHAALLQNNYIVVLWSHRSSHETWWSDAQETKGPECMPCTPHSQWEWGSWAWGRGGCIVLWPLPETYQTHSCLQGLNLDTWACSSFFLVLHRIRMPTFPSGFESVCFEPS